MYGFPQALYRLKYEAPGAPELAYGVRSILERVEVDNGWGIDHGTWSVLCHLYPDADVPVSQLSVDLNAPTRKHYLMGKALKPLRHEGVLTLASGNEVHDLRRVNLGMEGGYPWADSFDDYICGAILEDRAEDVIRYERSGASASDAFQTPDHFSHFCMRWAQVMKEKQRSSSIPSAFWALYR